jgi:hypothetical protein
MIDFFCGGGQPEKALRVVEVNVRKLCRGALENRFALQKRALPPFIELSRKCRERLLQSLRET